MLGRTETLDRMERGFNPRNVVVIGAAKHNQHRWLKAHLPFHQNHGHVLNVNIDENEWPGATELGIQNYRSILEIEEPVDYVTISVPRNVVPRLIEECIRKEVAIVHIYTAGFEESGEEEGIRLDREISAMARKAGLLIIGPNCMGVFNPAVGIRQSENQYYGETGNFGYISQSGSMASGMVAEANAYDVKMSKCISMGNGMVLDVQDYLDYFAEDAETKVIGMYLEGVRNPHRFFESLRAASSKKTVLVWKVGQTEDAARATQAHTGTSYMQESLWNNLLIRCGAIPIESQDEMIDTVRTLSLMPFASGYNVGLYASTGGHSTDMANVFSKNGFKVVPLTDTSYKELGSFLDLIGRNFVNPIQQAPAEHFERIVNILSRDENVDLVALEVPARRLVSDDKFFDDRVRILKEAQASSPKPIVAIISNGYPKLDPDAEEAMNKRFTREGILAFPSFLSGARALKTVVDRQVLNGYLAD
ncbi:MAG: CoA-binding protein [Chloroflexi bacterium]|nr:CoA-binding protein [Chloroflexota bacterium]